MSLPAKLRIRIWVVPAVAAILAGCASGLTPLPSPTTAYLPSNSPLHVRTLSLGDAWLRHHMVLGSPDSALSLFSPERQPPVSDALLQALQQALLHRAKGDLQRSNHLFEWADQEAERRFTRSATRTAASFLINDRVLEYTPTASELAMIPFYRLLNYMAEGNVDAAAVEARRLAAVAERLGEGGQRCTGEGMLQYVAALAFEAAGEWNDALVSLRRSEEGFGSCGGTSPVQLPPGFGRDLVRVANAAGIPEIADSATLRYSETTAASDSARSEDGPTGGEVIVLIEHGFVVHRTGETLHVPVLPDEIDGLDSEDSESVLKVAAAVAARLTSNLAERERWGSTWDDHPGVRLDHALSGAHVLKLTWPGLSGTASMPRSPWRIAGETGDLQSALVSNLSASVGFDLERERPAILARLVARSLTKYLLSTRIEKEAEEKGGEFFGYLAGRVANLAANEMERPDTRSWTLLPAQISVIRAGVAAGSEEARLSLFSDVGEDAEVREGIELGPLKVREGERKIVSVRVY